MHDWIRREEGFRGFPYRCSAGKLTIGYGRNLEDRGISSTEGDTLLLNDVAIAELALVTLLGSALTAEIRELYPVRYDALVNMSFQLGISRLGGFKRMIAAVRKKDWALAALEGMDSRWATQTPDRAGRVTDAVRWNRHG